MSKRRDLEGHRLPSHGRWKDTWGVALLAVLVLAGVSPSFAVKSCGTEPWIIPTETTGHYEIDNPQLRTPPSLHRWFGLHVTAKNGFMIVYEGDDIRSGGSNYAFNWKKLHMYRLVSNVWAHSQTWAERPMASKFGDRAQLSESAAWMAAQDIGTYTSDSPPNSCGTDCDGTLELYKRTGDLFNTTANQILTHPLGYTSRAFGSRYAFLGDTELFVGARLVGSGGDDSLFYFKLVGDTWTYQHEIQTPCGGGGMTEPLVVATYNHPTDDDQDMVTLTHIACGGSLRGGISVMFRNQGGANQFGVRQVIESIFDWGRFGKALNIGLDSSNNLLLAAADYLDGGAGISQAGAARLFRFDNAQFLASNDPFPTYATALTRRSAYQEVGEWMGKPESSIGIGPDIVAYGSQALSHTISEGGSVVIFCKDQGGIDNWGYAGHLMANNNVDDGVRRSVGSSVTYHEPTHEIIAGAHLKDPDQQGAVAIFKSHSQPFGATGPWTCILCDKGEYIYIETSPSTHVACATCTEGYQDTYNRSPSCKLDCPPGSAISSDKKSCDVCPAGTYSTGSTQVGCTACPSGTYNNQVGQSECTPCAAGYAQPGTGSLDCSECPPGLYAPEGSSSCLSCGYDTYNDERAAGACKACPLGGVTMAAAQTSIEGCLCAAEWAGDPPNGLECVACELEKVQCPFPTVIMTAKAGYYTSASRPNVVTECVPTTACLGGSHEACAEGYEGTSCSSCADGYFRSLNGCEKCPANSLLLTGLKFLGIFAGVMLLMTIVIILAGFCQMLQKKVGFDFRSYMRRIMAAVGIVGTLMTYMQTIGTVMSLNIDLPDIYSKFMTYVSIFNLDISLVAQPECDAFNSFLVKYIIKLIGVLVFIIVFSMARALSAIFPILGKFMKRAWMLRRDPESPNIPNPVTMHDILLEMGVNFFRAILATMKVAYLPVHTMVLEPLRCVPTTSESSGQSEYVMVVEPSLVCYGSDSNWTSLIPPCVIFFLIFSCGGQLVINLVNVSFHRNTYREHDVGTLFNVLWIPYEEKFYFWESVVVLRKFVFGLVTVTSLSAFDQLSLFLVVIVVFASFTVMARPYKELFDDLAEGSTLITLILLLAQVAMIQTESQSSTSQIMMGGVVASANVIMMCILLGILIVLVWPREVVVAVKSVKTIMGDDQDVRAASNPYSDEDHKHKLDILQSTKDQRLALIRDEMYSGNIRDIITGLESAGVEVETEITERSAGKADHAFLQQYRNYVLGEIEKHEASLDRDIEKTQEMLLQVTSVLKDPLLGRDPMELPPSLDEPSPEESPFQNDPIVEEGKVKDSPRILMDSPRSHQDSPREHADQGEDVGGTNNDSPKSTPRETPRSVGKADEESPPDRPFKPRKVKYDPNDPELGDFEPPKTIKFQNNSGREGNDRTKGGASGIQTKYGNRKTMGAQIIQGHLAKMKNNAK